jgi:hypothetical protein
MKTHLFTRRSPARNTGHSQAGKPSPNNPAGSRLQNNGAGWSSPVARQAHNLKVAGSNPAPATKNNPLKQWLSGFFVAQISGRSAAPESYRNQIGGHPSVKFRTFVEAQNSASAACYHLALDSIHH